MNHSGLENRWAFEKTIAIHNAVINNNIIAAMIMLTTGMVLFQEYAKEVDPEYLKEVPIENTEKFSSLMEQMRKDSKDILKGFKEYNEDMSILHTRTQGMRNLNSHENFLNGEKALHAQNCKELDLTVNKFANYEMQIENDNLQYIIREGILDYLSKIKNLPPYDWDLKVMLDIWVKRSNELLNDSTTDRILKELLQDLRE